MTTHIVKQGECLSKIAYDYKLPTWRIIYDHPQNAAFKAKRPNPNLIYPGDQLYIPNQNPASAACQTNQGYVFELKLPPTFVSICIENRADEPIAAAPYELTAGGFKLSGTTDGQGWVRGKIPAWAEFGELKLWPYPADPATTFTWKVRLGHLDPLTSVSGIKGRLANLDYYAGAIDDAVDEAYDTAVRRFQQDHGLVVDGVVGPKTRAALDKEHRI